MRVFRLSILTQGCERHTEGLLQRMAVVAVALCYSVTSWAAALELFTTNAFPVTGQLPPNTTVYVLDRLDDIEAALSQGLPAEPTAALHAARQALPIAWQTHARELTRAYQALYKAKTFHLTELPALVVDGQPVAVGVQAVQAALQARMGTQ